MVCRNVYSKETRALRQGKCGLEDTKNLSSTGPMCFSAFLSLTPYPNSKAIDIGDRRLRADIRSGVTMLADMHIWMKPGFIVFMKGDYNNMIEYVLVYLTVPYEKPIKTLEYIIYFDHLFYIGTNNVSMQLTHYNLTFFVEVAQYGILYSNGIASVSIPSKTGAYVRLSAAYDDPIIDYCADESIIMINKLETCPFINLSIDEFKLEIENDFLIFEVGDTTNHTSVFSKWEYEKQGGNIYLCLEDFKKLYQKMPKLVFNQHEATLNFFLPKNILSLVCVCASIVCLVVTITTYWRLSVLQSQPGINNLILAVFLLLAQSVYQFGAGQNTVSTWACALIGAICHFLWLAVMFAMNVCCIQMFTSFRKRVMISKTYTMRQTVKNITYIVCVSILLVFVNLVVSLIQSGGQTSGYGGKLCYLSSPIMQLMTFVIPTAVVLLANFAIFLNVVFHIRSLVRSTSMINNEKHYLSVYVRLSALTGLTWIFGFLQILLNMEFMEYIFIIFNASQGVFIMLAFVFNERVLSLICRKKRVVSTTKQTSLDRTQSTRSNA